jgi:undecaprenyl-diphosphatase
MGTESTDSSGTNGRRRRPNGHNDPRPGESAEGAPLVLMFVPPDVLPDFPPDFPLNCGTLEPDLSWFEAIILGLVQGLTEFIPVSSTAHVRIVSALAHWSDPGSAFTAVTQLGTEAAVLIYFRTDIWRIIVTWCRSLVHPELRGELDARMGWFVIIGTIPIGILGLAFKDQITSGARDLRLIAAAMILVGLVLLVADRIGARRKELADLTVRDSVFYGLAQACALLPGVSRSGGTISAGLFMNYTREAATRYSFLLAVPAVLVSGLFEALKIGDDKTSSWGPTLLATAIAFAVGYVTIGWLLRYVATNSFLPFVIYRLGLGVALIILLAAGTVTAR